MGYQSKVNVSIKNDRIVILEQRAAAIEAILNQRIEIFIKLAGELKGIVDGLLRQEIYEVKQAQELIYEELISRTLRGRMKRLAGWLNRKKNKTIPGGLVPGKEEKHDS
jgi:hypothetical protein